MELLKNFNSDIEKKIKESNIIYNSHYFSYNDDDKFNNNLKYKIKCFDDNDFYKTTYISQDYISSLRRKIVLNNNKFNNIYNKLNNKLIKSLSFGINHMFHDENWIRFDKDNFICKIDKDNINCIYCNSVSRADLDRQELINFVKSLQDLQFGVKLYDFDENDDFDEDDDDDYENDESYNNNKVVWMVICEMI